MLGTYEAAANAGSVVNMKRTAAEHAVHLSKHPSIICQSCRLFQVVRVVNS